MSDCLTYFTKHNTLYVHPCCWKWQTYIVLWWVILYLIYNLLYFKKYLFILIDWWFLYNSGLISVIHQHELTIGVHIFPPSWISLPLPTHSHPDQFSLSVVSNSLRPHGPQHARLPCPSPIPEAYSNSRSLSWCYHLTISSSLSVP